MKRWLYSFGLFLLLFLLLLPSGVRKMKIRHRLEALRQMKIELYGTDEPAGRFFFRPIKPTNNVLVYKGKDYYEKVFVK